VLLSADTERPNSCKPRSSVAGSRFTYAIGTLVLWSPKPGIVDADGKVLTTGRFKMLGIADPKAAPYGAAAQQVLAHLGLWDKLNQDKNIATGENINQAWQFAVTGNVDLAFVALSQVTDGKAISGSYWLPPQSLYTPLEQDAIILSGQPNARPRSVYEVVARRSGCHRDTQGSRLSAQGIDEVTHL